MSTSSESDRIDIPGSDRRPLLGAQRGDRVDRNEELTVTVLLRRPDRSPDRSPTDPPLSREEFLHSFGADPGDIDRMRQFAATHGLAVRQIDEPARTVELTGTAENLESAFQVELYPNQPSTVSQILTRQQGVPRRNQSLTAAEVANAISLYNKGSP
jgi:kumamolisin